MGIYKFVSRSLIKSLISSSGPSQVNGGAVSRDHFRMALIYDAK